jgi:hypothetical protein
MDRDRELADDYTKMANLVERFEKRQALVVEGNWCLIEKKHHLGECLILTDEEVEEFKADGWTVTSVTIFRKS